VAAPADFRVLDSQIAAVECPDDRARAEHCIQRAPKARRHLRNDC
jgi:hypothetical protein